ncbi:unnamed protein product [Arabidopsis halleri]
MIFVVLIMNSLEFDLFLLVLIMASNKSLHSFFFFFFSIFQKKV